MENAKPVEGAIKARRVTMKLKLATAAMLGALAGCGATLFAIFGDNYLGWTRGTGMSFPRLITLAIPLIVKKLAGWDDINNDHFSNTIAFQMVINALVCSTGCCLAVLAFSIDLSEENPGGGR
jgi:hypothetical protein